MSEKKGRQGEGGGKPLKWETPEELIEYVENFFTWCEEQGKRPTVTRLAYYLECDRQTLLNYENSDSNGWLSRLNSEDRKRYVGTIKRAKMRIESEYEDALFNRSETTGAIFTLKNNYSWADRQEIVTTNKNENSMSEEDIEKQLKDLGIDK
jgi:organic radical activating enzyme